MMKNLFRRRLTLISMRWLTPAALVMLSVMTALAAARAADQGWPREIKAKQAKILVYQPQLESFHGDRVSARCAVSVQKQTMKEPVFGVVWFVSRVSTDRDTRQVTFEEIKVDKMKFPDATPKQEQHLAKILEEQMANWPHTMSLDRLLAMTEAVEKQKARSENLNNNPPVILFRTKPTELVLIDGKPIVRDLEGSTVQRVVNTPFVLLFDKSAPKYYLFGDGLWFAAADIMGPWENVATVPSAVAAAAKKIAEAEVPTQIQPQPANAEEVPEIIVATQPTALIVANGKPQFAPLTDTGLLYMTNTGRDVFMPVGTQEYYVLLSGRWFKAPSLEKGPWSYVPSDQLPAAFYKIPPGSDKQHVLAFVAGTSQAEDAVADAQLPQTEAVPRNATTKVTYSGEPKFSAIEGTPMQYAENTNKPVIKANDRYYAVDDAVWYTAAAPQGPWQVATSVPPEIYTIPPDSPVYNVTYVRIYQATPSVVYMGYTPGYTGTYIAGGTVVYGTGYVYPAYVSGTVYFPPPVTYGYAPVYNPYYGAWSFMAGATFGFVAGAAAANWWGWGGWRGDVNVDINRNININRANWEHRSFQRAEYRNNIYKRPQNWRQNLNNTRRTELNQRVQNREQRGQGRLASQRGQQLPAREKQARTGQRRTAERQTTRRSQTGQRQRAQQTPAKRTGSQARAGGERLRTSSQQPARQRAATTQQSRRAASREMRQNNVFADRNGNVYRNRNNNWQQRQRSGWSNLDNRGARSSAANRNSLQRDYNARARGAERANSFQRMQSSSRSQGYRGAGGAGSRRGGAGGGRGGGRRR